MFIDGVQVKSVVEKGAEATQITVNVWELHNEWTEAGVSASNDAMHRRIKDIPRQATPDPETTSGAVYQDMLERFMLPSADKLSGDAGFIFQQDLAQPQCQKYQFLV